MRARSLPCSALILSLVVSVLLPTSAHAQGTNLARGKSAIQSATPYGASGLAEVAVDGNTNGEWNAGSVTHTDEHTPYWQVDLGDVYDLSMIRIWNRTDCCRERLRGFWIMAAPEMIRGNNAEGPLFVPGAQAFGDEDSKEFRPGSPVRARYVRIFLDHEDYLSLAEVEVYGTPAAGGGEAVAPRPVRDLGGSAGGGTPGSSSACPPGFTPAGPGLCNKPSSAMFPRQVYNDGGRGLFNSSGVLEECTRKNPQGCDKFGMQFLVRCPPGSNPMGPNMCMVACPDGWTDLQVACKEPASWTPPAADDGPSIRDGVSPPDANSKYEDVPYMNPGDLDAVMNWIEKKAIGAKLPFCWRGTYTDPGHPVTACPPGYEPDRTGGPLSLCYTPCPPGYDGSAFNCTQRCPPGFTDNGIGFCRKPGEIGRGVGHIPAVTCPDGWNVRGIGNASWCDNGKILPWEIETVASTKSCGPNEELYQATGLCYPKCPENYYAFGSNVCTAVCPPGYEDAGISCTRKNQVRDQGVPRTCDPGDTQDGPLGLCYPAARAGFHRVGPVYWQNCDDGWTDCGAGCQKNTDPLFGSDPPWRDCATTIVDQVSSVVILAANIASLGLAAPETGALHAAQETITVGGKIVAGSSKAGRLLVKTVKFFQTVKPTEATSNIRIIRRIYNPRTQKVMESLKTTYEVGSAAYDAQEDLRKTFSENFAEETSPEIDAQINAAFSPTVATFIKRSWADAQLGRMAVAEGWQAAELALTAVSIVDISGVTSVVAAYAKPVCQENLPFPRLQGYYK